MTTLYSNKVLSQFAHIGKENDDGNIELLPSPLIGNNLVKDIFGGSGFLPKDSFIKDDCFVTASFEYESYWDIA